MKPSNPLKDIKTLVSANLCRFNDNALEDAHNDFMWGPEKMKQCLLKLNDRLHSNNPEKNHFYKTEPYRNFPNTKMDYYKIRNGLDGNRIYIHLYINPQSGELIISSFKEL